MRNALSILEEVIDMDFVAYERWLAEYASCIDCGARYSDRPRDVNGRFLDVWVTETQCRKCFSKFGKPEKRGLPSARTLANVHGVDA